MSATGGCMCGNVRYTVTEWRREVLECHCERCRRILGNFMAAPSARVVDITLDAQDTLSWYSTDGAHYGFCATCGSSLFWRHDDIPKNWSVTAGTIDPPHGLRTVGVLWASSAADHVVLTPDVPHWDTDIDDDDAK